MTSLFPQQRAQVSERELRYLWVLVSLSATESVQDVLLEGHPSWKYLQEVQMLLLNVQQGLTVSCAEEWQVGVCVCTRVCMCVRCGQRLVRERVNTRKDGHKQRDVGEVGEGCRKRGLWKEEAAVVVMRAGLGVQAMPLRLCSRLCLSPSGSWASHRTLFVSATRGSWRWGRGRGEEWMEHRECLGQ